MTDVFLYSGEPNPNDVKLRDPTTPASGGGSVTIALTGVSVACVVGTLAVSLALGLSGISRTASPGTLGNTHTVPITKVSATGNVGFTVPLLASGATLTGVSASASVGSLTSSRAVALTKVSATGTAGSVSSSSTLGVTGNQATAAAGNLALDRTAAITGVQATGVIGTRRYLLDGNGNKILLADGSGYLLIESGLTQSGGDAVIDIAQGGGYGLRPIVRYRKVRRISEREQAIEEIIYAIARQQIGSPRVAEAVRAEQLAAAMAKRGIEAEQRHAEALAAERSRLISMEVAALLRKFQNDEDEALLFILAEVV